MASSCRMILIDFFNTLVLLDPSRVPRETIGGKERVTTAGLISNVLNRNGITPENVYQAMRSVTTKIAAMRGEQYLEVPAMEKFKMVLKTLDIREDNERLAQKLVAVHMDAVSNSYWLPESHLQALDALRGQYRLGLLSNCDFSDLVRSAIRKAGLMQLFNPLVISEEIGIRKPSPEAFRQTLALSGLGPEDTIFVGDSMEDDVAGAQNAGLRAVWVNPEGRPPTVGVTPDFEINGLHELPEMMERG